MEYPPPENIETIYNPLDYAINDTSSSSSGTSSNGSYVNYPSAQGPVDFPGLSTNQPITFSSTTGTDRALNQISNIQLIDTTNSTPTDTQTDYTDIYQSGADLYITNNSSSSIISVTSDSTTFSNDITVDQHLYLSSDVYMKANVTDSLNVFEVVCDTVDLSCSSMTLGSGDFSINLADTTDTLTFNSIISCDNITSTNLTASSIISSGAIDVSSNSLDFQSSSFALNMPSTSDTLTINSNISCGTITSGNITSSQISNSSGVGSNVQLLSSFPTTNTGTNSGLAVGWNNVGGLGEIDLIGMGSTGAGGFAFYGSSYSTAPVQLLTLYPNSGTYPGATFASGLPVKFNTTPTAPTMASGNSSTSLATTAFCQNAVTSATAFTNTPTCPTKGSGNSSTSIATTAFVSNAVSSISTGYSGTIELVNNCLFDPSKASPLNTIGGGPVYNLYNCIFISFPTPVSSGKVPTVVVTSTYTYQYTGSTGIVFNTNFNGFICVNLVVYNGFYVSVSTSTGAMPAQKVYFNYIAILA